MKPLYDLNIFPSFHFMFHVLFHLILHYGPPSNRDSDSGDRAILCGESGSSSNSSRHWEDPPPCNSGIIGI